MTPEFEIVKLPEIIDVVDKTEERQQRSQSLKQSHIQLYHILVIILEP